MKVFVTGVCGQLGYDVICELGQRGYEAIGSDIQPEYAGIGSSRYIKEMTYVSLDITDSQSVRRIIKDCLPDVIIHCAAWTNVDGAEEEENREKVDAINKQLSDTSDGLPPVQISAGLALGSGRDPEELFRMADASMYNAKSRGGSDYSIASDDDKKEK